MGCQPVCNRVPPILIDPTDNEIKLWNFIAQRNFGCGQSAECLPLPILENPTECENQFLEWLRVVNSLCHTSALCEYVPPLTDIFCPSNIKALEFEPTSGANPSSPGGSGRGRIGDECDPLRGGPLQIKCLDPNDIGPGSSDCSINCDSLIPEIRFRASGGEPPYSWELSGVPVDCINGFGGVGGPGFGGPEADGLCDSRFVVTAPDTATGFDEGRAAFFTVNCCQNVRKFFTVCFCEVTLGADKFFNCLGEESDPIVPAQSFCSSQALLPIPTEDPSQTCCTRLTDSSLLCAPGEADPPSVPPLQSCGGTATAPTCPGCFNIPFLTIACGVCTRSAISNCCTQLALGRECGKVFDNRTQDEKDDGCLPCELCFEGLIATVTDSIGSQTSVVVTVDP